MAKISFNLKGYKLFTLLAPFVVRMQTLKLNLKYG
jgi:hypothetical protein